MLDGKTFPNFSYTLYVHNMCVGATLTRSNHFLSMRPIGKNIHPIYKLPRWAYEGMHVRGLHSHDDEPFFSQNLGAFNCGTNSLCRGGAWGSGWLNDHSRQPRQQWAFILTKYIYIGNLISSSKSSPTSYNNFSSFYRETLSSSPINPCHFPFPFSTSTTNIGCSQYNNTKYFLYSRFGSCDKWLNYLMPLGTKSFFINVEHIQPHGRSTFTCCGSNGILLAIWHDKQSRAIDKGC